MNELDEYDELILNVKFACDRFQWALTAHVSPEILCEYLYREYSLLGDSLRNLDEYVRPRK